MKDKLLFTVGVVIILLAASAFGSTIRTVQDTCPDSNGWVKINSNDMSLYPVDGAVEYCFKAGSDQSQGCVGGIFSEWPLPDDACGLSHWAYKLGDPEPTQTPQIPTSTWTPTPQIPTNTPQFTVTPDVTLTSTPPDTPTMTAGPTETPPATSTPFGGTPTPWPTQPCTVDICSGTG